VELIGAKIDAIKKAEDRLLFKDAMRRIGLETPQSQLVNSIKGGPGIRRAHRLSVHSAPQLHPGRHGRRHRLQPGRAGRKFWSAASTFRRFTKSSSKRACWVGKSSSWR